MSVVFVSLSPILYLIMSTLKACFLKLSSFRNKNTNYIIKMQRSRNKFISSSAIFLTISRHFIIHATLAAVDVINNEGCTALPSKLALCKILQSTLGRMVPARMERGCYGWYWLEWVWVFPFYIPFWVNRHTYLA